jgi:hypothetical protein
MPLADDIEEFRRNVAKAIEELEEVRSVSDKLTACAVDEIHRHLTQLQDLCEQASIEIKRATEQLIEINTKWGSESLKSYLGQQNKRDIIEKRDSNLITSAMAESLKGGSGLTDVFQDLAEYRQQLGLPIAGSEDDRSTVAKLEIGDRGFFGINSSSNPNPRPITLRVNPISRSHAEADALQQAFDAGVRGGRARLVVDRDLCRACGQNGGVKGMARQLDLEELEVISPSGREVIQLK